MDGVKVNFCRFPDALRPRSPDRELETPKKKKTHHPSI
jgi:hypothetical protein